MAGEGTPLVAVVLLGLAAGQAAILWLLWREGAYLQDSSGAPLPVDFLLFWASGVAARSGEAAAFYDPAFAKAAEAAALGHDFPGFYRWVYPPTAYLITAPLSVLPLVAAQALFTAGSLAAFAAVLARMGGRLGALLALACPAWLACATVGQNGFIVAALLGAAILSVGHRPVLSGLFVGLLTAKPHLGLLVPLALLAGGHWRTVGVAAATAFALALLSIVCFGLEPWRAFAIALPATGGDLLGAGIMGFGKLQSAYGLARSLGLPGPVAAAAQITSAAAGAALVWRTWRGSNPAGLRTAALAAGAALATPYLYLYDLVLLALPAAALLATGPSRRELAGLSIAALALLAHSLTGAPTGLAASLTVAALVAARAFPLRCTAAKWATEVTR